MKNTFNHLIYLVLGVVVILPAVLLAEDPREGQFAIDAVADAAERVVQSQQEAPLASVDVKITKKTEKMALVVKKAASVDCMFGETKKFDALSQMQALSESLKQYYSLEGDLELSALTPLVTFEKAPATIELLSVPERVASTMLLKVRYRESAENYTDVLMSVRAQWRMGVFVPKRAFQRGMPLFSNDFEVQTIDRLALKQVPVSTTIDLADYEASTSIPAGSPLTWNFIKAQPLVRKGALVDVMVEDGNLKITTRAVALKDAGRGEQVLMKNLTTNRQFEAYVINPNLAQIRL